MNKNNVIILPLATIDLPSYLRGPITDSSYLLGNDYYDVLYPNLQKRPSGHLKFLLIFDCKLIVLDQDEEQNVILLDHPFILFCLNLQHNQVNECLELANKFHKKFHYVFADMFFVFQNFLFHLLIKNI